MIDKMDVKGQEIANSLLAPEAGGELRDHRRKTFFL